MIYISTYVEPAAHTDPIAVLEVDYDSDAECIVVMDRFKLTVLHAVSNTDSNVMRCRVPLKYIVDADILVMMLDNTRTYNAVVHDGVKCTLESPSINLGY